MNVWNTDIANFRKKKNKNSDLINLFDIYNISVIISPARPNNIFQSLFDALTCKNDLYCDSRQIYIYTVLCHSTLCNEFKLPTILLN